jgi:uncharacterized membrane protein YtjA (UPF0391 family)
MLRRGVISALAAMVFGLWGFAGPLQSTAPLGQELFLIAAAFSLVSLLLSLFEPYGAAVAPVLETPASSSAAAPEPAPGSLTSGAIASTFLADTNLEGQPMGIPDLFSQGTAAPQKTHPQPT